MAETTWKDIVALLIEGGSTYYGIKEGKKSQDEIRDLLENPTATENLLTQIAQQRLTETAPIRMPYLNMLRQAVTGGMNRRNPMFAGPFNLGRKTISGQYNVARENILSAMPRGGVQQKALADLETTRAGQIGDLGTQINQDLMKQAFGVAFDAPGEAVQALSPVASSQSASRGALATNIGQYNRFQTDLMMRLMSSFGDYYGYSGT